MEMKSEPIRGSVGSVQIQVRAWVATRRYRVSVLTSY